MNDDYEREEILLSSQQKAAWFGARPKKLILWRRDYDRIKASKTVKPPEDIEIVCGPVRPASDATPIHK